MDMKKTVLNQLIDLGGIATKNNFYSESAKNVKSALVNARKVFNELERLGLIKALPTITRVRNKAQEQFYAITKPGARYIGRTSEYRWRGEPRSPNNVMHESMVRDVALAFLRNYPDFTFEFRYDSCFDGLRPDITIKMTHKETMQINIFFVEIERKKTVDRVRKEKLEKYEKTLSELSFAKHRLYGPVKILILYANLDFNCFLRPQEYYRHLGEIVKLEKNLNYLVHISQNLPEHRYRFLSFNNFQCIHELIWKTPTAKLAKLI